MYYIPTSEWYGAATGLILILEYIVCEQRCIKVTTCEDHPSNL